MKKKVKIIGGILLALLAAGGAGAYITAPLTLETAALRETTAKVTFTEQGSYIYDRSMTVYPQISGEVLEVRVKQGQNVKKGDVLAVVSASDYEYQIKTLESNIAGYQAQIQNLYTQERDSKNALYSTRATLLGQIAEVNTSLKDFDKTQKSLDRQLELQMDIIAQNRSIASMLREDYKDAREYYNNDWEDFPEYNAIREAYLQSQNAVDMSVQQYEQMQNGQYGKESLEAQRDSLEAQLAIVDTRLGQNGVAAMQQYYNAMIEGTKRNIESMTDKLGQAVVTAPIDGVVDKLPVRDSNLVTQGVSVATICAQPAVEVYVPIREIDGVHIGDKVELVIDKRLGGESIAGTVEHIESEAEVKISALGVEERKVRVLIRPETGLNIGYGMDVKFTVFEQENAIVVPKTAVFEKDGQDMVWAIENGTIRLAAVQKVVETRDGYAVTGLEAGGAVVTDANTEGIREGKNIKTAE